MPESRFVECFLHRVRENSVDIEEVIRILTISRNISKSSAIASSVSEVLMSIKLETWFLEQLQRPHKDETTNLLEFKDCLMAILRGLALYTTFSNLLDDVKQKINISK